MSCRSFAGESVGLVIFTAIWGALGNAWAADPDKLIQEGVDLRRAGDDVGALQRFQQALEIAPSPRASAQVGLAEQALGRWIKAYEHLHDALDRTGDDSWIRKHQGTLSEALEHVRDHVGQVEILGGSPGAEIRIDGALRGKLPLQHPILVPTGTVTIDVAAAGFVSIQRITVVHARETIRESFDALSRIPVRDGTATSPPTAPPLKAASGWSSRPSEGELAGSPSVDASPEASRGEAGKDDGRDSEGSDGTSGRGGGFRPKAKWIAWGGGAATMAVAAYGWALQNQAGRDFSGGCAVDPTQSVVMLPGSTRSLADCRDLKSKVDTNYRIEIIGLIGAGLLVAAGFALWVTEPPLAASTALLSCSPELTAGLRPGMMCQMRF